MNAQEFETEHTMRHGDARDLRWLPADSADLAVTSPPYPMIAMWDEVFGNQCAGIADALAADEAGEAFEAMHRLLDGAWLELARVLKPGGIACVNIGDATRTVDGRFRLFNNHARVIAGMQHAGFDNLPNIIWRKSTNAPNKFMGSGMLPPGAYVTLEHEHVLVFRLGAARVFLPDAIRRRRESGYFWEERNRWFSDVWTDLTGVRQELRGSQNRTRSGAFPLQLAQRLIHMFSVQGDVVLDPFAGLGTARLAALGSGRNSIGVDLDEGLVEGGAATDWTEVKETLNALVESRLRRHSEFVVSRRRANGELRYQNQHLNTAVMTRQEQDIKLPRISEIAVEGRVVRARHAMLRPVAASVPASPS